MPHQRRTFQSSADSQTSLDVQFADRLTAEDLATIIGDLVRSLAYQKKQIPLQYDAIKRDLAAAAARGRAEAEGEDDADETAAAENPREAARRRRAEARHRILGARYLKRATDFMDSFDHLVSSLESEIAGDARGSIVCVSVMFGSTPVTPREVYHVYPPKDFYSNRLQHQHMASLQHQERSRKKAALQLFRAMITDNRLFDRIGRHMNPTNMFIAVKKRATGDPSAVCATPEWLQPRPEFSNLQRGSVTEFRLSYRQETTATLLKTPRSTMQGSLTPIPMDLCTPCEPKKSRITPVRLWASSHKVFKEEGDAAVRLEDDVSPSGMEETPCVKRTPLYRRSCAAEASETKAGSLTTMDGEEDHDTNDEPESDLEWFVSVQSVKGFKDPRITSK